MKRITITTIIILLFASTTVMAQGNLRTVSGTVTDGKEPITGANVFIHGTIDGCSTDSLGRFNFETEAGRGAGLCVKYIGYEDRKIVIGDSLRHINIIIREKAAAIDEVVITSSSFRFGQYEGIKQLNALDIVMSGNSCGDIYAALHSLPGTQRVGESGKLYVRGGDENECHTFINGMHVMAPYTSNTENNAVRGRFSPFLFKGMNFSVGGYGGEYGGALSAILPMETTDTQTADKLGVSASLVDRSIGGTKAFGQSSLSFNANYLDMGIYNKVSPDIYNWIEPYRKLSGEMQYKSETTRGTTMKTYVGYDLTKLKQETEGRNLGFTEHNIYVNCVIYKNFTGGTSFFAGVANSTLLARADNSRAENDRYDNRENEIHLKTSVKKVINRNLKASFLVEDYIRNNAMRYGITRAEGQRFGLNYNLFAANINAVARLFRTLYADVSMRTERTSYDNRWTFMPRTTVSYVPDSRFRLSLAAGRYSQMADNECMMMGGNKLEQSSSDHYIASTEYKTGSTLMRLEAYYKKYRNLPLLHDGYGYCSDGYGMSRGIDVFIENASLIDNLTTTISYSFNDAKRLYLGYTELSTPQYSTRHNVCVTAKYYIPLLKTYVGMAENFASGRPYHNPFKNGYMNDRTKPYNSLDVNMTFLLSRKVILYTSVNNVLGRKNIFNYVYSNDGTQHRTAIKASRERFFYIGLFISLKNNKAYDISNF